MNITILPDQVQAAVNLLTDLRSLFALQLGLVLWLAFMATWVALKGRR